MEKSSAQIQTLRRDTELQVNEYYMEVVQTEEKLDDLKWRLEFCRGICWALEQVEGFMAEGGIDQSLLRLQTLRVSTRLELAQTFKLYALLRDARAQNQKQLSLLQGKASTNGAVKAEIADLVLNLQEISESALTNERELHFKRGAVEGFGHAERNIIQELNPQEIPGRLVTSPGAPGPNFEGQAMPKRENVKFPEYPQTELYHSEHQPQKFNPVKLEEL